MSAKKMASAPTDGEDIEAFLVNHNVGRHLRLYQKTGDGLLIWRAYQEYRQAGLAVPENLLKKFDQFAARLCRAGAAAEVAAALEMDAKKGGPAGATRTKGRERERNIVEFVRNWLQAIEAAPAPVHTRDDVFREAAARFGTTANYAKKLYYEWIREAR